MSNEKTINVLRQTMAERVAGRLRDQILDGQRKPGSPLKDQDLTVTFDVSRHVVREALRLLSTAGLVSYSAFKGVRVATLTEEDVREIYQSRTIIEAYGIAEGQSSVEKLNVYHEALIDAVERRDMSAAFDADQSWHSQLVLSLGNRHLSRWHAELLQSLRIAGAISPDLNMAAFADSIEEHDEVTQSLLHGKRNAAVVALQDHLKKSESLLLKAIRVNGDANLQA